MQDNIIILISTFNSKTVTYPILPIVLDPASLTQKTLFLFQIDTGNNQPICCKPSSYVPRESEVIQNLVGRLCGNGVVEEGDVPWGEILVLAEKPHQENVPWHDYQWRLCFLPKN